MIHRAPWSSQTCSFLSRLGLEMEGNKNRGGYRQINKALNICAFEDYLEAQQSRLPKIADVEQISPRVIRVLGQNAGKVSSKFLSSCIRC